MDTISKKKKGLSSNESNAEYQNLQMTNLQEIKALGEYHEKKVNNEHLKPLDQMLDSLGEACVKVLDSHIDRLAWKFKPKLDLAR